MPIVVRLESEIMNQQQETRQAAAQAFIKALEQLHQSLEADVAPSTAAHTGNRNGASAVVHHSPQTELDHVEADLSLWADAIADIDQFIQKQNKLKDSY